MTVDYVVLWALVVTNSLAILLLIRQVAALPVYSRRAEPKVGSPVEAWELESLDGSVRRSSDLAHAYTLLFVQPTCGPCHTLFEQIRRVGRTRAPLYIVAQGDASSMADEARSDDGNALYDLFLLDRTGALFRRLQIPGTPYSLAVAEGRVAASGVASGPEQLFRMDEALFRDGRTSAPAS